MSVKVIVGSAVTVTQAGKTQTAAVDKIHAGGVLDTTAADGNKILNIPHVSSGETSS